MFKVNETFCFPQNSLSAYHLTFLLQVKCNSFVSIKVKHLRTKYKVLDIEVDGGVGIPTIDAAAQVPLETVTIHGSAVA